MKFAKLLFVCASVPVMAMLGTAYAQAGPDSSCTDGRICGWAGTFYGDGRVLDSAPPDAGGCVTIPTIQSAANVSGRAITLWSGSDCTGDSFVVSDNFYTSIGGPKSSMSA
ncbi:peptidase inhibitor family I36 protein [Nocardia wallacei]|uniref:peptidase inhibitor family I36 protein n=1 Tax=Nocardia wallacei TaxID=480035 RepID=UPI0024539F0E|nr:peptidase inhibitor family I36 protein [Nocardia wallacei]